MGRRLRTANWVEVRRGDDMESGGGRVVATGAVAISGAVRWGCVGPGRPGRQSAPPECAVLAGLVGPRLQHRT